MSNVGKNIRGIRTLKKMTQDDLAEKLFVSRQTVSNYEVGKSKPDIDTLVLMSQIFEIEVTDLIYGSEKKEERRKEIVSWLIKLGVMLLLLLIVESDFGPNYRFDHRLSTFYAFQFFSIPFYFLFLGISIMDGIMLFVDIKKIQVPYRKILHYVLSFLLLGYCIVIIPTLIYLIYSFIRACVDVAYLNRESFSMGYEFGFIGNKFMEASQSLFLNQAFYPEIWKIASFLAGSLFCITKPLKTKYAETKEGKDLQEKQ